MFFGKEAMVYTVMSTLIEVFFVCFSERRHTEVVLMRQINMKNVTINAKLLDHYRFLNVKGYVQQFFNFHKNENGTPVLN